jgi:hypothetical protein
MKKLILVVALAASLTGCASLSQGFLGFDVTASVTNPVTPAMLYRIEEGARIATAGLLTYRRLCIVKKIDQSCRQTIASIQVYTRKLKPILISLRTFVRTNDQVNAISAFNLAREILTEIQVQRTAAQVDAAIGAK